MEPDYSTYGSIDFVLDDSFIRYILHSDPAAENFWKEWLNQHSDKKADFDQAIVLLHAVAEGLTDYSQIHLSEEKQQWLLQRIRETNSEVKRVIPIIKSSVFQNKWLKISAAVLLIGCLAGWLWNEGLLQNSPETYYAQVKSFEGSSIEKINSTAENQKFYLPDSTEIVLFPNSRISYSSHPGNVERKVVLQGKARFDVIRNPDSPFLVYAEGIITKVLGTVFEVDAFENSKDITVKVESGKVSVFKNSINTPKTQTDKGSVLLSTNQQVVFSKNSEKFDKQLVQNPIIIDVTDIILFDYEETPVTEVFSEIEKAYGVHIIYDYETLKNCQLTASLWDESLSDKLDIICKSIGLEYEIVETSIVVSGKGCKRF